ncbi:MAG: hypothetical protein U0103_16865 [Candidatus Obscuribacterales bacterium]
MSRRFDHPMHTQIENTANHFTRNGTSDQSSVNESNFASAGLQAFEAVDLNRDGLLQKQELENAVNYNVVNGAERKAVQVMLDNFDVVDCLSGDLPLDKKHKDGISKSDLEGFDKIRSGESSFLSSYAMSNIKEAAYYTSYVAGALSPLEAIGLTVLQRGASHSVLALEVAGCVGGATLLGMAGAAGYSYYKYKHEQSAKVTSFLNELNASSELRSRL